jgi:hypothetical protein
MVTRSKSLWQWYISTNIMFLNIIHGPAYEEGHTICWNEAKVLQIEPNSTYRKYKESAHVSLIHHPISQTSLDISPIWSAIFTVEVKKLQLSPV